MNVSMFQKAKTNIRFTLDLGRVFIFGGKPSQKEVNARRIEKVIKKLEPPRRYCSRLPAIVEEPFFVKVGAHDGVTGDPCSDILVAETRWKGLLIEPVPDLFQRLRQNFSDTRRFLLEQVAIGSASDEAIFYHVDPKAREHITDLPRWFDQLSSLDRNHILKHLDGVLEPFILESTVRILPLSALLEKHSIKTVHLLHIDAEGHDYEVLKTLDFARHAPVAIFVEHKHLSSPHRKEMRHLLHTHGYSVKDCGGDYFALDEKAEKRLERNAK